MSEPAGGGMRRSVEKRLKFLEFRLYWEGKVNRSDLVNFFGISIPQASADISRYLELAPDNMIYDKSAKMYLASPDFKPRFHDPNANRYLTQIWYVREGIMPENRSWQGWTPAYDFVPSIERHLDPDTLRVVLQAVHAKKSVEAKYQSMSRPEPIWRRLSPHALVNDGFRWHVRAWCHLRAEYLDFVFARILDIKKSDEVGHPDEQDWQWHQKIVAKIGPNPKLGEAERKAIELDYGMQSGVLEIPSRICLWPYLERRLGLDMDIEKTRPQKQHIILLNREEIEQKFQKSGE